VNYLSDIKIKKKNLPMDSIIDDNNFDRNDEGEDVFDSIENDVGLRNRKKSHKKTRKQDGVKQPLLKKPVLKPHMKETGKGKKTHVKRAVSETLIKEDTKLDKVYSPEIKDNCPLLQEDELDVSHYRQNDELEKQCDERPHTMPDVNEEMDKKAENDQDDEESEVSETGSLKACLLTARRRDREFLLRDRAEKDGIKNWDLGMTEEEQEEYRRIIISESMDLARGTSSSEFTTDTNGAEGGVRRQLPPRPSQMEALFSGAYKIIMMVIMAYVFKSMMRKMKEPKEVKHH
jgi:hypothetical protein